MRGVLGFLIVIVRDWSGGWEKLVGCGGGGTRGRWCSVLMRFV